MAEDPYHCLNHKHYYYIFSIKPRKVLEIVQEAICPDVVVLSNNDFKKVCEVQTATTYVCEHPNPTPAHRATINTTESKVSTAGELFECATTPASVFTSKDLEWIDSGMIVPFSTVVDLITNCEPDRMLSLARDMAIQIKHENSKNDILEELIKKKLGNDFTVTHKATVARQGQSFSPYSRSRHDLCIQHKLNNFKSGIVRAAIVGSSVAIDSEITSEEDDGDVVTSVIEFKANIFSRDQTLAQMICTLTDTSIDILKKGKQINKATIYGLSVKYSAIKAVVYKLTMDFSNNTFSLVRLTNELSLCESLNFLVSILSK